MQEFDLDKLYKEECKLHKKLSKLEYLINNSETLLQDLPLTQLYLLNIQLSAMKTYHSVLVTRIDFLESAKDDDMSLTQYEDFIKDYIKKQS